MERLCQGLGCISQADARVLGQQRRLEQQLRHLEAVHTYVDLLAVRQLRV